MKNFIQVERNGYTIKIKLNMDNYGDIPYLLDELNEQEFNWKNFHEKDALWYKDGMDFVICVSCDHAAKILCFDWREISD